MSNPRTYTRTFLIFAVLAAAAIGGLAVFLWLGETRAPDRSVIVRSPAADAGRLRPQEESPDAGLEDASRDSGSPERYAAPGGLRVRVVDSRGRPVPGASVAVAGSGLWPSRRLVTDADGWVLLTLIPGRYDLQAEKAAEISEVSSGVAIKPDTGVDVELQLERGSAMAGVVKDAATGRAVPGARITALDSDPGLLSRSGRSDSTGAFRIAPVVAGKLSLYVRAAGYRASRIDVVPGALPIEIRLERGEEGSGMLPDEDGRVAAAGVRPRSPFQGTVAVELEPRGKRVVIASVAPGSNADAAGLARGDALLAVDRRNVRDVSEARFLLLGHPGSLVLLTVERKGEITGVVLQRETP